MSDPACYQVKDVAAYLGIRREQVYELIKQKKIPSLRVGLRRVVIPGAEFEEWKKQGGCQYEDE